MPELILSHANVLTCDHNFTRAEAVAVTDGRITAIGTNDDIVPMADARTNVVNLNGATLLPGFFDAHCHALGFGIDLVMVDLSTPPVQNIGDLLHLLQQRAAGLGTGDDIWVRGRGYDQNKLTEKRHPTRQELDTIQGGKAYVLVTQTSGHAITVNSRVLARAGINRNTPDPVGGTIVRDDTGEPTGLLLENAMDMAYAVAPEETYESKVAALGRASQALLAMGITSATEATADPADIAVFREAARTGLLHVRCTLMMLMTQLMDGDRFLTPQELRVNNEGPFVQIGPAKIFSDGALTTRTALLREPYADNIANFGTAMWGEDALNAMILGAHAAGWQIAAHAIGDRAIDLCLDAYDTALMAVPRPDARHRIEHAMLLWDDQIARMVGMDILPAYQPEFIAYLGDAYIAGLGRARADRLMPYQASAQAGLPLVFSSDLPVVPGSPLAGIASAVQRRTPNDEILGAAQRVTVEQALRAYTAGAAYSLFADGDRGVITPGQRADLVVLTGDPSHLPPDEWRDALSVQATLIDGAPAYGQF